MEEFVLNLRVVEPGYEEVIFGPKSEVDEWCGNVANIDHDNVPPHVQVRRGKMGAFFFSYHMAYNDVWYLKRTFLKFDYYLRNYYIPLSEGKRPMRENQDDDPFGFLDSMRFGENVIYSFVSAKIDYYIQWKKKISPDILVDFFEEVMNWHELIEEHANEE